MATDAKRKYVADVLKNKTDSLFRTLESPNVIIMGDFNDYPSDESIRLHLQAGTLKDSSDLVNLMLPYINQYNVGSHKYHAEWGTLDQFIVSKYLLLPDNSLKIVQGKAQIFHPDFLLIDDEKFMGKKPFRTFLGFKYIGGYSDHLPVFFDIVKGL